MKEGDFQYNEETRLRLAMLHVKFLADELSDDERLELEAYKSAHPINNQGFEERTRPDFLINELAVWARAEKAQKVYEKKAFHVPSIGRRWPLYAAVAAALVAISVGLEIWLHSKPFTKKTELAFQPAPLQDILPGDNQAVLTLSDGKKIILDSTHTGTIAEGNGSVITKLQTGSLAYTTFEKPGETQSVLHTLTTPASGTFMVRLPDNTKVWLNNQSSLRYPSSFAHQSNREVELTGEAYFDVASSAGHPFIVNITGGRRIEVLGTAFNVKAYPDEMTLQTTLVNGLVKIATGRESKVLHPGDQATIDNSLIDHPSISVSPLSDMKSVLSWKDNLFYFHKSTIDEVMRQLARWYGIQVIYEGKKTNKLFFGMISRQNNVSDILKVLEASGVHCRIEASDKKIIVLP